VSKETYLYVRGRLALGLSILGIVVVAPAGWIIGAFGYEHIGAPIFVTGWGLAAGSFTFLGAFEQLTLLRLMQDLPTARIRSAHQGYVELQGTVCQNKQFITCPQCGEPCLWFHCFMGKNQKITPRGRSPDIVLDDDTGQCLVLAAGAELHSATGGSRHVHIKEGDMLHVLGEFRSHSATASGVQETPEHKAALRERLQALKRDARRMALFDRNKDGTIDSREWEAARKATELKMAREPAAVPETWRPDHVVAKPTTEADRLPFVIFVGTESEAIARARIEFGWRLFLAVAVGLIVAGMIFVAAESKR